MSASLEFLRIDQTGHVAELVLDRAPKLNAMTFEFFDEVKQAMEQLDRDESVRVVILRAEGRMFTAGLDLGSAMAGLLGSDSGGSSGDTPSEASNNYRLYQTIRHLQDCFSAVERCRKPVIAAIHGKCIGGGVDLTTACDIRLATEDAEFSIMETKIAIVADVGTLQRITAIVGKGMAREMAFTGKYIDSARALRSGLVNEVYANQEALLAGARAMAEEIAANSPVTVQGVKQVLNYSDDHNTADGLEHVAQWNSSFLRSHDLNEAVGAFLEKRKPEYRGN